MAQPSKAAADFFSIRPYMITAAVVWTLYNWAFAMVALKLLRHEFPAAANRIVLLTLACQCFLWLLGLGGIGLVSTVVKRRFEKQRESEAALQESEEKFRTIIEQSTDGFVLIDEQGGIIEWNQAQERISGFKREDAMGKLFWNVQLQINALALRTPEQHEHFKRIILDAIASGTSPYFGRALQGVVPQKDGTQKIIQETFFPIKTGRVVRLGSIIRDVTEQKHAEDALKQSEERLRSFMEQANDSIFICDSRGIILFWNRKAAELYGYTADEIVGKPNSIIVPPRFRDVHRKWMQLFLSGDESAVSGKIVEGIGAHKDGREFNLETSTAILHQGSEKLAVIITRDICERKRAEQEQREAKEFLENVFRTSGDGLIVTDDQGYIQKPNDKALKIFGYTEHEMTGMHFAELSPLQHTLDNNPTVIEQLLNDGFIENREAVYKRKDGSIFPAETNMRCMKDKEGRLIGAISSMRDITERRISDEKLREAKEQLEKFLENSIDPIMAGDSTGHIVKPNKAFLDMIGYTADEIIGNPVHGLSVTEPGGYETTTGATVTLTEDIFAENYCRIEQLFKNGKISNWETFYIHKSGKIIPVTQNIILTYNDQGAVTGSFSIIRDLTSAKKAEVELRVSEERFRAIAESSQDAIVTIDRHAKITFCNSAIENLFNFKREELLGQPADVLVAESQKAQNAKIGDKVKDSIPALSNKMIESFGRKKDGQEFPIEVSVASYFMNNEVYFTSTIRDITERKKLEEQIRQSQKMEAIGTLAGGIAHDFNNILAAIIGFTEMSVQKLEENTPLKRNLEQVLKSSYRARDLVKQILTFSRKNFEERKPIEISPIIKEALKLLRASIPTTIDIQVTIDRHAGMINADPTQMHQILMNLCTNAAHAMSDSGGVLDISLAPVFLDAREVSLYQGLEPGAYLLLTVHDTGGGIDPAIIDRIFEPFFTTKEVGQGSGMGLAVVHGIVKSHGGAITVDSKPGAGTAFHIVLPQVEDRKEAALHRATAVPTGSESILYVDDEAALAELGQEMLESLGYRVTAKKNSLEALEEFKADPRSFDIIITDQTMPAMTGFDLAKQAMDIRPDIPVILCTGHSDKVTQDMARDAGIREFVMKPMTIQTLAETVRSALATRPM